MATQADVRRIAWSRSPKHGKYVSMTFKPRIWYPIAILASLANVVAVGFAAQPAEPVHATIHAALAVAFGLWAQRLKQRLRRSELPAPAEALEALEVEVTELRRELSDAQERLDFTERLLAQRVEALRPDQER